MGKIKLYLNQIKKKAKVREIETGVMMSLSLFDIDKKTRETMTKIVETLYKITLLFNIKKLIKAKK